MSNNVEIIKKLSELANKYDQAGETKKADLVDQSILELMKEGAGAGALGAVEDAMRGHGAPSHGNNPYLVEMRGVIADALRTAGYQVTEGESSLSVMHPQHQNELYVQVGQSGAN